MLFVYPDRPHHRKHGPSGYVDYTSYKDWLRDDFCFRCVYCLERERWDRSGHAAFGVDHVKPQGRPEYAALVCVYGNLVYACNRCNVAKRDALLLDPCAVALGGHMRVDADGKIEGLTVEGWELVLILGLDQGGSESVRRKYLRELSMYERQPTEPKTRAMYLDAFSFPDDLPNLGALRPKGNSRPEGMRDSYWRQRREGRLPEVYF